MSNRNVLSDRISEVLLIVILVFLLGLVRIYFGAGMGPMVVWKGAFGYDDTLVNLDKVLPLSRDEMIKDHAETEGQLEEMYIIEPHDGLTRAELRQIRLHGYRRHVQQATKAAPENPATAPQVPTKDSQPGKQ
jgi:hypothetical protein